VIALGNNQNNKKDEKKNPDQISIYMNNKAVLELMNKLRLNQAGNGSYMHALKDENNEYSSCIGINAVDYQSKKSVFVTDNLSISHIMELYEESKIKRKDFKMSTVKIFGNADKEGLSIARKLNIERQGSFVKEGKTIIKDYPWKVNMQNGRGIKLTGKKGEISMKQNSFTKEKEVTVNLSDSDFFALLLPVVTYIRAWEQSHAVEFVKETQAAIMNFRGTNVNMKEENAPDTEQNNTPSTRENQPSGEKNVNKSNRQLESYKESDPAKALRLPPGAKIMVFKFTTKIDQSENENLFFAEVVTDYGKKGTVWFQKEKLKRRLKEFEDAMANEEYVKIYYTIDNEYVFFEE